MCGPFFSDKIIFGLNGSTQYILREQIGGVIRRVLMLVGIGEKSVKLKKN